MQHNNSNAADGRKPLVLSSRLFAAADLSRYAAQSSVRAKAGDDLWKAITRKIWTFR